MAQQTPKNETNSSVFSEYVQRMQNLQSSTGLPMAPMEPEISIEIERDDITREEQELLHEAEAQIHGIISEE